MLYDGNIISTESNNDRDRNNVTKELKYLKIKYKKYNVMTAFRRYKTLN